MPDVDERGLPALDTFSGLVLALTALSGELPAALVSRTVFYGHSTVMAFADCA